MKVLLLSLVLLLCSTVASAQTGQFCFEFNWPTLTAGGNPADSVGVSSVYFEIYNAVDDVRKSTVITDTSILDHCFTSIPVGSYQFAHRSYDSFSCEGITSAITNHMVTELREKLAPAVVVNIVTEGSNPSTPIVDCENNPDECEVR